jgi:hypothetical protein
MPFVLKFHDNETTGLVAICNVCGKQVEGDNANILWDPNNPDVDIKGKTFPFKITCKGNCTRVVDHIAGHQYSQELDTGLIYLLHNTKTDMKSAIRKTEILSELQP